MIIASLLNVFFFLFIVYISEMIPFISLAEDTIDEFFTCMSIVQVSRFNRKWNISQFELE